MSESASIAAGSADAIEDAVEEVNSSSRYPWGNASPSARIQRIEKNILTLADRREAAQAAYKKEISSFDAQSKQLARDRTEVLGIIEDEKRNTQKDLIMREVDRLMALGVDFSEAIQAGRISSVLADAVGAEAPALPARGARKKPRAVEVASDNAGGTTSADEASEGATSFSGDDVGEIKAS